MESNTLLAARGRLTSVASEHFASDPDVLGVFLGGSLAAGSADVYSDIDMRVVVTPESHPRFVERRRQIPMQWPGFLFNEWLPSAQHCVSHFQPFGKIDIFYYSMDDLQPSPWLGMPIKVLHDPKGMIADLVNRSQHLRFSVAADELDYSISKGLAAAHEVYRRAQRGELFYAQTLLDELRQHIMHADDWLFDRTPDTTVHAKFDTRASKEVRTALIASYCPCEASAILAALRSLVKLYRAQVLALHDKFELSRLVENDIVALESVS